MDLREYIQQKSKKLETGSLYIRDYRVFDFNYIPQKPLMRDEIRPIADAILRYMTTGIPNHLLIIGSRGCGKTVLVKSLIQTLSKEPSSPKFLYVNCRHHNTSFKILADLLQVRPRGYSLDELWSQFQSRHPGPLVLVLDEVDLISEKDRNKDLLYLLSRSENNYMSLMLSNNPRFHTLLDSSVKSTLQPEVVHFKNYDAEQVFSILQHRARLGLREVRDDQLRHIAALTVRNTNSDVRVGIKTLYFCALESESGVEGNFQRARRDIARDILADLNDKNLIILQATQQCESPQVKPVYGLYRRLSHQYRETPFSYVYFYSNLSYLQSLGLILLISTKIGRSYTNRIQPLFEPETLHSIWQARFG